jgi:hypothetical protein
MKQFSFYDLNLNPGFKPVDWCRDALNIISKSDVELAGPHISKTSTLGTALTTPLMGIFTVVRWQSCDRSCCVLHRCLK